jgi:hypothetical protein
MKLTIQILFYNNKLLYKLYQKHNNSKFLGNDAKIPHIIYHLIRRYFGERNMIIIKKLVDVNNSYVICCYNLMNECLNNIIVNKINNSLDALIITVKSFYIYLLLTHETMKDINEMHEEMKNLINSDCAITSNDLMNYEKKVDSYFISVLSRETQYVTYNLVKSYVNINITTEISKYIVESVNLIENTIFGMSLMNPNYHIVIKILITSFIRHYIIFIVMNYNHIPSSMTDDEEKNLIIKMSELVYILYVKNIRNRFIRVIFSGFYVMYIYTIKLIFKIMAKLSKDYKVYLVDNINMVENHFLKK